MKILISQKRFHPNSIGLVKSLLKNKNDVRVFVSSNKIAIDEEHTDVNVIHIGYNSLLYLILKLVSEKQIPKFCPPRFMYLFKSLRDFKPDIVILKKLRLHNFVLLIVARIYRVKKIIILNNSLYGKAPTFKVKLLSIFRIYPKFVINTAYIENYEYKKALYFKAIFLPYPIDTNHPYNNKNLVSPNKIKILFVGSFASSRKRPEWILESLKIIGTNNVEKITFVGTGSKSDYLVLKLHELAKTINFSKKINVKINVPHKMMNEIYSNHDIFVFPAKNEPFGAVVIEALSNGLPLIVSDTCGSKHAVHSHKNGYIFNSEDHKDFTEKLKIALSSPANLKVMGRYSRALAQSEYSLDSWYEKFCKFLNLKYHV